MDETSYAAGWVAGYAARDAHAPTPVGSLPNGDQLIAVPANGTAAVAPVRPSPSREAVVAVSAAPADGATFEALVEAFETASRGKLPARDKRRLAARAALLAAHAAAVAVAEARADAAHAKAVELADKLRAERAAHAAALREGAADDR